MTDILLVNIDNWPVGVFADPTTVEGRAAWYSFAFWLRLAAGAHMDVDALELQASFRTLPDPVHSAIGQAFLCDQLENGAGYCRFLASAAEFQQLLQQGNPNTSKQRLGYSAPVQFGNLRGYIHQNSARKTILIERHPLWNDQHPDWNAAYVDASAKHPNYGIRDLNPFRLLRRPADYV